MGEFVVPQGGMPRDCTGSCKGCNGCDSDAEIQESKSNLPKGYAKLAEMFFRLAMLTEKTPVLNGNEGSPVSGLDD
ncbi:MAG: hypothetical protein WCO33_02115 [bacterium]